VLMTPQGKGRSGNYGRVVQALANGQYVCQPIDSPMVMMRYEAFELAAHTPPAGNYGLSPLDKSHGESGR
jgi:hypothetical protein